MHEAYPDHTRVRIGLRFCLLMLMRCGDVGAVTFVC
jgi:hypothetical protein